MARGVPCPPMCAVWLGMLLFTALVLPSYSQLTKPSDMASVVDALASNLAGNLQLGAHAVADGLRAFWDIFGPGGKLHPGWFLEHKGHLVIEGLLIVVITILFMQRPQAQEEEELTERVGGMAWGCIATAMQRQQSQLQQQRLQRPALLPAAAGSGERGECRLPARITHPYERKLCTANQHRKHLFLKNHCFDCPCTGD